MDYVDVARRSASGSFILYGGNVVSNGISAVTILIIARLLGPGGFGAYTLLLVFPVLFQSFVGLGINTGITQYAALYLSKGEPEVARRITIHGLIFIFITGIALFLVALGASAYLSSSVLHRPELTELSELASSLILVQTLFQSVNAALLGYRTFRPISLSVILQAGLRLVASVSLILLGLGVLAALLGHILSILVAGALTGGVLYIHLPKKLEASRKTFSNDIVEMLRYGWPVYVGGVVFAVASQYVPIVLSGIANNVSVGYYQSAVYVVAVVNLSTSSVATALFPAFSTLHGAKGDTRLAFGYSVKYMGYFISPTFAFALGAAGPLIRVLYGVAYGPAATYLALLSVANLPLLMGLPALAPFFNGVGLTRRVMYVNVAGAVAIFGLAPLLAISEGFGIPGLIYSLLASNLLMAAVGLALATWRARALVFFKPMLATLTSALLALVVMLPVQIIVREPFVALGADAVVFLFVYLTSIPYLGGVEMADLERLRVAVGGLGSFSKLILPVLGYERRLLQRRLGVARNTPASPEPKG